LCKGLWITRGGRWRGRPVRVTIAAMDQPWTLTVLPTGEENLIELDTGREATREAAFDAATEALVACAAALGAVGRQEYRITVADDLTIITPGLTSDGLVDLVAIHDLRYQHSVY
jgi:hypothetical protein